jgi:hypothetical protein
VAVRSKAPAGGEVLLQPTESIRVFKNQPLAQRMDKSGIARAVVRAIQDAARVALQQRQIGGGGVGTASPTSTGAGGAQGDKGKGGTTPTAPAPPSAPPPPPPGG